MENNKNLARNTTFYLESSVIKYGIYNTGTIEKLADIIQKTWNEILNWYLSEQGCVHYAINSILYINTEGKIH